MMPIATPPGELSGRLANAAAAELRAAALADLLDEWETAHGPLSAEELTAAAAELGIPAAPTDQPAV